MRAFSYWWFKVILVGLGVFFLMQLVPYRVDTPPARDEPAWDSPNTRALAVRACFSCHSNETKVLPFEKIAPIQWYIANHVKEGRAALNFSEWNTAAGGEAHDAWEAVGDGMPPSYYTYFGLHKESKLTPSEFQELTDGLKKTIAADPPAAGS
ncbi:MAG: heme-binding domain-containing protein [Aquihabitans sp.]